MSGIYLSTCANEVRVNTDNASAVINTATHSIEVRTHGRSILQVQCSETDGKGSVRFWLAPPWLAWVLGERVTVSVRRRQGGAS